MNRDIGLEASHPEGPPSTYFNIEHKNIVNMARKADLLGIDLVVLDDGWFGEVSAGHTP